MPRTAPYNAFNFKVALSDPPETEADQGANLRSDGELVQAPPTPSGMPGVNYGAISGTSMAEAGPYDDLFG